MLRKIQRKRNLILLLSAVILCIAAILINFIHLPILSGSSSNFTISNLKVSHLANPLGIDDENPTFSWQMSSSERGTSQSAYRLVIAESTDALAKEDFLWDSGKQTESRSVGITCDGLVLAPKQRYYWQVTVWNQEGAFVTSTETAWFETGLMGQGFPEAKWISASLPKNELPVTKEELTYSIEYRMEIANTAASFVFGATEGRYGEMYLCEIENNQEDTVFRLKKMSGGSFVEDAVRETDITLCRNEDSSVFAVKLCVDKDILSFSVNDISFGSYSINPTPVGSIGYYKSRGTSYAYLDELIVTDSQGQTLYQEDFSHTETIFSPYYISLKDKKLKIGSGLLLTPGFVSPAPLFRREFITENQQIERARLYMTALGSFPFP